MCGITAGIAEDGELVVKGPLVCKGYHNNPEVTTQQITDGWLHTGDLGDISEDGFISITGRKKDLIITAGGKNVSPIPMEQEIAKCPIVEHAVVVGDNRPFIGALVTLDPEGLAAWLPSVACPRIRRLTAWRLPPPFMTRFRSMWTRRTRRFRAPNPCVSSWCWMRSSRRRTSA